MYIYYYMNCGWQQQEGEDQGQGEVNGFGQSKTRCLTSRGSCSVGNIHV